METPVNHIELVDGKPVIAGRNVKVKMVAGMYLKAGASIEAIMEQYDLTAAEVHAALAYYYDNQAHFEQEARKTALDRRRTTGVGSAVGTHTRETAQKPSRIVCILAERRKR